MILNNLENAVPDAPMVFFDLDDTLLDKDTNSLWLRWRVNKDFLSYIELVIGLYNYFYYKCGMLTEKKMFTHFKVRTLGMTSDKYKQMVDAFFLEYGQSHIYPAALELVNMYKKNGSHIVLITGQEDYLSEPFFTYFKMDGLISNRRKVRNRKFAGFHKPNCYGAGKITLAESYAKKHGAKLSDCAFYTDSISDLPLLNLVGHPIAVNPDASLKEIAVKNNWPILTFKKTVRG